MKKLMMDEVTWEEIDRSELPSAVDEAFKENGDVTFKKALKGSNGHYKIKADKDGSGHYFKYDASGKLLDSGKTADREKKKMEYETACKLKNARPAGFPAGFCAPG